MSVLPFLDGCGGENSRMTRRNSRVCVVTACVIISPGTLSADRPFVSISTLQLFSKAVPVCVHTYVCIRTTDEQERLLCCRRLSLSPKRTPGSPFISAT